MRNNLIHTSVIVCIAWSTAGCHAIIDHTEENQLIISVDSTGNKVMQETTSNNTRVTLEYKGEVDIEVDRNGSRWFSVIPSEVPAGRQKLR